jgi:hypothetical protein
MRVGKKFSRYCISTIHVISPIFFHINHVENGNEVISSEENFENSKPVKVLIPGN